MADSPAADDDPRAYERELLLVAERRFAAGDPSAIPAALYLCLLSFPDMPIPEWVRAAFIGAYQKHLDGESSWEALFGRLATKSKIENAVRDICAPQIVWDRVMRAHAEGEPIGNELFERIGRELGIGGRTTVQKLYNAWSALHGRPQDLP